jgi:hypothetical protein
MRRQLGNITGKALTGKSLTDSADAELQEIYEKNQIFSAKMSCFLADPSPTNSHFKERTYIGTARMDHELIGLVISYDENCGYAHGYIVPYDLVSEVRGHFYAYKLNPLDFETFSKYFVYEVCDGFLSTLIDSVGNPSTSPQEIYDKLEEKGWNYREEQENYQQEPTTKVRTEDTSPVKISDGGEISPAASLETATEIEKAEDKRRKEEALAKSEDDRRKEEELEKLVPAHIAIEYNPVGPEVWAEIQLLPNDFQDMFLERLVENPQQNLRELKDAIKSEFNDFLNPYDDPTANNALDQARSISPEAEGEFVRVYELLGKSIEPSDIISRIEQKFGPTQKTKENEAREREENEAREREEKEARQRNYKEAQDRKAKEEARKNQERRAKEREWREARQQDIRRRKKTGWLIFFFIIMPLMLGISFLI